MLMRMLMPISELGLDVDADLMLVSQLGLPDAPAVYVDVVADADKTIQAAAFGRSPGTYCSTIVKGACAWVLP